MNGYALDSNIVSFRIKMSPIVKQKIDNATANNWNVQIPPFAYYEVKRGLSFINAVNRLRQLDDLCIQCPVGNLDNRIINESINIHVELKRKGWNIDEMDIFIAAWCRVNDFTLVTNNTAHFARIPGLRIEDWSV